MSLITITVVKNSGDGRKEVVKVQEGTTVLELMEDMGMSISNSSVMIESSVVDRDRELQNGDVVSVIPKKIPGAAGVKKAVVKKVVKKAAKKKVVKKNK
jgi:sulfur carrier protein ThiS